MEVLRMKNLVEAVKACVENNMSIRKAAVDFDVKRSTLHDHVKKEMGTIGAPRQLTEAEEEEIVSVMDASAEWGFPLGIFELR